MRIKIFKSEKPQEDYLITGKMVIIESDEGIPLAFFKNINDKNYLLVDAREQQFPLILKASGINLQIDIQQRLVTNQHEPKKIVTVENGKISS
ncbi:MAG: hypothetical protein KatS3mg087_0140 [Patescibacteria group bacterium]|nr:MAG: hypothetical protein KatS3mg087_0140 [Patescibacteria group bacterium]